MVTGMLRIYCPRFNLGRGRIEVVYLICSCSPCASKVAMWASIIVTIHMVNVAGNRAPLIVHRYVLLHPGSVVRVSQRWPPTTVGLWQVLQSCLLAAHLT